LSRQPRASHSLRYAARQILRYRSARATAASSVEIVVETTWRSLQAIRAFSLEPTGKPPWSPKTQPALLSDYDRRVLHYEVSNAASAQMPNLCNKL
jgi:hypothetical protein